MKATVVLSLIGLVILLASCGGNGGQIADETESRQEQPTPTIAPPAPTSEPTVEPTSEPSDEQIATAAMGERVDVKGYPDVIVEGFNRAASPPAVEGGGHFEVEPGREFLIVTLRVVNDTDLPAGISEMTDLSILSRRENIVEALTLLLGVEDGLEADVLPVGQETTGIVAWSMPPGFDDLELVYSPWSQAGMTRDLPIVRIALE